MKEGRKKGTSNSDLTPGVLKPLSPDFCPFCGGKVDYYAMGDEGDGVIAGCKSPECMVRPLTFGNYNAATVRRWWAQIWNNLDRLIEARGKNRD